MDEMNDHDMRQIDREVSGTAGLIALVVCLAVILGILLAGGMVLIRQFF